MCASKPYVGYTTNKRRRTYTLTLARNVASAPSGLVFHISHARTHRDFPDGQNTANLCLCSATIEANTHPFNFQKIRVNRLFPLLTQRKSGISRFSQEPFPAKSTPLFTNRKQSCRKNQNAVLPISVKGENVQLCLKYGPRSNSGASKTRWAPKARGPMPPGTAPVYSPSIA